MAAIPFVKSGADGRIVPGSVCLLQPEIFQRPVEADDGFLHGALERVEHLRVGHNNVSDQKHAV
jgi:hypothetical protein